MKTNTYFLKSLVIPALLCSALAGSAQTYTWMKGSNQVDPTGTYGTAGTAAPANNPGGRDGAVSWTDATGNLWLFGGGGYDSSPNFDMLNDLWKYDPASNNWAWMKGDNTNAQSGVYGTVGTPAMTNKPGGRGYSMTWTDNTGNLWLFGGYGYDNVGNDDVLNDLWKYNIATNQWTWMSGSNLSGQSGVYGTINVPNANNVPGARMGAAAWMDASGNLWLFGGFGYDNTANVSILNDLWRYNTSTNQWTWMGGSSSASAIGIYGTMGTPSAANVPGSRMFSACAKDASGNFWLFGGFGSGNAITQLGDLQDLWRFNPATSQWTWMSGTGLADMNAVFGTQGVAAPSNIPGSRDSHVMWADNSGNLWLMGGNALDASAMSTDFMNDLWKYDITSGNWAWMKGSNQQLPPSVYGTLGVGAIANTPGGRSSHSNWTDGTGNLWLFGGFGDINGNAGELNDLWKITSCPSATLNITAGAATVCPATTVSLQVNGPGSFTWSTGQQGSTAVVTPSATTSYSVSSTTSAGCSYAATYTQSVYSVGSISVTTTKATVCKGQAVTLNANGASNYSWQPVSQSGNSIVVTPSVNTTYTVTGTDANGCNTTGNLVQNVSDCTGIAQGSENAVVAIYPNPSRGLITVAGNSLTENGVLLITNVAGQQVLEVNLSAQDTVIQTGLNPGIYLYQVNAAGSTVITGKLVIE